jgi:hypothetical protein
MEKKERAGGGSRPWPREKIEPPKGFPVFMIVDMWYILLPFQ